MNILFLHPNFPGQFRHLAAAAARQENSVKFLCQTHYGRTIIGVERITLKHALGHETLQKRARNVREHSQILAEQYRNALTSIKNQGWKPDLVISHSGWGCGLHVKEIWEKCRHISYLEWWFNPNSSFYTYDPGNKYLGIDSSRKSKDWLRNQHVALELCAADVIVSPTKWQASQLPDSLRKDCNVIFDGIENSNFAPADNGKNIIRPVITYGTRGMDPMRGFPEFIRSLPKVLKEFQGYSVEIAGDNKAYYGIDIDPKGKGWMGWAQNQIRNNGIEDRVRWVGHLPLPKYRKWLKSSMCHIYLTHPFVASWSLVESYVSGVPMVVSDVEPVQEFCSNSDGISFVDHRDDASMTNTLIDALSVSDQLDRLALHNSRETEAFDICQALKAWERVAGMDVATIH